ncbi:MAG: hypothetical protein KY475_23565 [Planctomycetes bacterium]|nr:hypothetical protein [Planctomycetota bacterium]
MPRTRVQAGRTIVLVYIVLVLLISAATITLYVASKGPAALPPRIFRLILTVGLCLWLYSGAAAAKWLCVVLFSYAGIVAFLTPIGWSLPALTYIGIMSSVYVSFAWMLAISPDVDAFLKHQREQRRAQKRRA